MNEPGMLPRTRPGAGYLVVDDEEPIPELVDRLSSKEVHQCASAADASDR